MSGSAQRAATYRKVKAVEWPSLVLWATIHALFAALTLCHRHLPWPIVAALGALLITWHSSMQHEFIHGHPTPSRKLNRALASVPLSLWLPFESYRMTHLVHHCDERLTDPLDDPESYYWSAEAWTALGPCGRAIVRAHTTLAGRLIIGPAWNISRYLVFEARDVATGNQRKRRLWLSHSLAAIAVLFWALVICGMPIWLYLAMIYGGTSILLLRSFAEHRAKEGILERTAIVENAWFFGPLFLFNNLHAAHHELPLLPWYRLPAWYRANRTRLAVDNGGLIYNGYFEVIRRFLLKPHDVSVHPLGAGRQVSRTAFSAEQPHLGLG